MQTPNKRLHSNSSEPKNSSGISSEIWLSVATAPVLAALVLGKVTTEMLEVIGQASEEVFRGERLPLQPFPKHPAGE